MTNPWKAAVAIFIFGAYLFAEQISPDAEKSVAAAEKQWQQAVLSGNRSTLASLMANDITYTHSSSMTQTKEQFIDSVVSGSTKYQSIEYKTAQMRQYGNTVIVIHDTVITTAQTGVAHLYLTHVWSKQNGHWLMVSRQATKFPEPSK
jgi:uncharacterized protein (TIGR02246 family)